MPRRLNLPHSYYSVANSCFQPLQLWAGEGKLFATFSLGSGHFLLSQIVFVSILYFAFIYYLCSRIFLSLLSWFLLIHIAPPFPFFSFFLWILLIRNWERMGYAKFILLVQKPLVLHFNSKSNKPNKIPLHFHWIHIWDCCISKSHVVVFEIFVMIKSHERDSGRGQYHCIVSLGVENISMVSSRSQLRKLALQVLSARPYALRSVFNDKDFHVGAAEPFYKLQ